LKSTDIPKGRLKLMPKSPHIKLNGIDVAVVRPERRRYPPELIEVVVLVQLRRARGMEDGDTIEVILL